MRREKLPKQITVLSLIWLSQSHADRITNEMLRQSEGGGGEWIEWEMPKRGIGREREKVDTKADKMQKRKAKMKARDNGRRIRERRNEKKRGVFRTKIDRVK